MKCRANDASGLVAMTLALAATATCVAGTVRVNVAAPDGGDGESWETAFNDLAVGLAAAEPGDEVWVAAGVYVPDGDREASFLLPDDVAVYGGFAGDETSREERDWIVNETTLSGDRGGDDGPAFENYDENCYHVVDGNEVDAILDGFTISGGNANGPGAEQNGGGLIAELGALTTRHCVFRRNRSISRGGGMLVSDGLLAIEGCSFVDNRADVGAGLRLSGGWVSVSDSTFTDNFAAAGGGGVASFDAMSIVFARCVFRGNFAQSGALGYGGGVLLARSKGIVLTECLFAANTAGAWGGGAIVSDATMINCVFSRNAAGEFGAGVFAEGLSTVINCTIGHNHGSGIIVAYGYSVAEIVNSVIWGNEGPPIEGSGYRMVTYSNVEGDHAGEGNIDADPRFVQPGTDNLRLAFGSPCVDAGSNDAVPEGVDVDLDGNPRIENGVVDMGAYEGEHDGAPARAETDDADDGERVVLVPSGGRFDPESHTVVIFTNRSGEDDAYASLTEYEQDRHPGARGFSSLETTALLDTSLDDGAFLAQMFIPFHEDDLDGADPFALDLTYYDEGVGNWALAVGRNAAPSPGHRGVFGDRIAREGPGIWGVTLQLGDYGVFFNVETRRGFVWANVDHPADFSSGVALCPADTRQPPDSNVDFDDILAVIDNWGAGPGPFDVNGDGTVDAEDLFLVLSAWGGCE